MFQFKCLEIRGHRNIFGMESFLIKSLILCSTKLWFQLEVTVNNIFIKNESINFKILAAKGLILMVHFSICFHNWFIFFVLIFHSQSQVRNQFNAPLWLLVTGLLKFLWPQNCILCFLPSPLVTPISWAGPGLQSNSFGSNANFIALFHSEKVIITLATTN